MQTTMESNSMPRASTNGAGKPHRFNPDFTRTVLEAMGPKTSPRMREVMNCLIPHLHDFAREIELTTEEWMEGVKMLNWAGQMSNDRRNEGQLVCDVFGLESLVDEITYTKAAEAGNSVTQSAILGPFYQTDIPVREKGATIHITKGDRAEDAYMYGRVVDGKTGAPLANATIEVWMASTNGLYEQQDENQIRGNLTGKFRTDSNGEYAFYTIRPTPYPIPYDGPAGKLLQLMDRHPYRPAHIHFIVSMDGYEPITTQIFDKDSAYLEDDSVFAVKDSLLLEFVPRKGDPEANLEVCYDIRMAPQDPGKQKAHL